MEISGQTVFVLYRAYDDELVRTVGVFSTREGAVEAANRDAKRLGYRLEETALDVWVASDRESLGWQIHEGKIDHALSV